MFAWAIHYSLCWHRKANGMKWINVNERLPELDSNGQPIDCELKQDYNDEILNGYFMDDTWWIEAEPPEIGHYDYRQSGDVDYEITHWRPVVNGSLSFKEQMKQDIIPRIWQMAEKEKEHLNWLIDNNAPKDMIERSQNSLGHFRQRHKEYIEYAEGLS